MCSIRWIILATRLSPQSERAQVVLTERLRERLLCFISLRFDIPSYRVLAKPDDVLGGAPCPLCQSTRQIIDLDHATIARTSIGDGRTRRRKLERYYRASQISSSHGFV